MEKAKAKANPEPEKTPDAPRQSFMIILRLETDCVETVDSKAVNQWASEIFHGCDMGDVEVLGSLELGK